ncbi:MAG: hypothetical protein K2Q24_15135 [Chitinophagaceae bacterium]|nr:hypothetical protein [Chitinophagaceae bacterium]
MEYLSTTSLAYELGIPTNELFSKLKSLGWIDRKNDKWILTFSPLLVFMKKARRRLVSRPTT